MHNFENDNGCTVTYEAVGTAMGDEPFTMGLTDTDEIRAVIEAVNRGISTATWKPAFVQTEANTTRAVNGRRASSSSAAAWNAWSVASPCPSCCVGSSSWRTKQPTALPATSSACLASTNTGSS